MGTRGYSHGGQQDRYDNVNNAGVGIDRFYDDPIYNESHVPVKILGDREDTLPIGTPGTTSIVTNLPVLQQYVVDKVVIVKVPGMTDKSDEVIGLTCAVEYKKKLSSGVKIFSYNIAIPMMVGVKFSKEELTTMGEFKPLADSGIKTGSRFDKTLVNLFNSEFEESTGIHLETMTEDYTNLQVYLEADDCSLTVDQIKDIKEWFSGMSTIAYENGVVKMSQKRYFVVGCNKLFLKELADNNNDLLSLYNEPASFTRGFINDLEGEITLHEVVIVDTENETIIRSK